MVQKRPHWGNYEWRKVVFNKESWTGDNVAKLVWRKSHEKFNEEYDNTEKKFPKSFTIWSYISYQGAGQLAIVLRYVNADVYQKISENFLLPSLDEWFGDSSNFIFQDDNAFPHRSKINKAFSEIQLKFSNQDNEMALV